VTEVNDGGPAFPCSNEQFTLGSPQTGDAWSGMTIRDWFAGQAPAAILNMDGLQYFAHMGRHANEAYKQADAMLAARANSGIISAAPEMLTALKWAESAIAPFSKEPAEKSGIMLVRAAIAKAEGRAP